MAVKKTKVFRPNQLGQSGMSLIELLIAIAIMGIISSGLIAMMAASQKDVRRIRAQQQLSSLASELQNSILHSATCKGLLRVPSGQAPLVNVGQTGTKLGQPIALQISSEEILQSGRISETYSDLRIDNIVLKDAIDAGTTADGRQIYTINMAVDASDHNLKLPFKRRQVGQFTISTNANRIDDCFVFRGNESQNAQAYCEGLNGNFVNGKCELLTPLEMCTRLGGQLIGNKCETLTKAEMCQRLGGTMKDGECITAPMPQRCRISSQTSSTNGSQTKCCNSDEVAFTAFAPSDKDFKIGFSSNRCMNVSDVGGGNPIQLLCCK